jgi:hypothetical protein
MSINIEKTAEHLRKQLLEKGAEERHRAIQALSSNYLNDSRASLANMLLASLGGRVDATSGFTVGMSPPAFVGKVAPAMQASSNDPEHGETKAS